MNRQTTFFTLSIGDSANAAQEFLVLLPGLPNDLSVIISHQLSPAGVVALRDLVTKQTSLKIIDAKQGDTVHPGTLYLSPAGISFLIENNEFRLAPDVSLEQRDKEDLINTTENLIWSISSDFNLIAANQAFINTMKLFAGVDVEPGKPLLLGGKFSESHLEFWKDMYVTALQGNSITREIYNEPHGVMPESWAEIRFNPIYEGEVVTGIACYSRDITAAKRHELELTAINKKLETAQQIAQLGYWDFNLQTEKLFWSDHVYKIWGVSRERFKLTHASYLQSIHPNDRKVVIANRLASLEGHTNFDIEYRIVLQDGSIRYVHEKGDLVFDARNNPTCFEGTYQDITERKSLQILLDQANTVAGIGGWELDMVNNTLVWSTIIKQIHGFSYDYTPDVASSLSFFKEGESRNAMIEALQQSIKHCRSWDLELIIITTKGKEKWIRTIGEPQFINQECTRIVGSFQDIDIRKKAELAVIEALREKNNILESITDGFYSVNKDWVVTYWNKESERLLGRKREEIVGLNLWDIYEDSISENFYQTYHQSAKDNVAVYFDEYYQPNKTWFEINLYPSENGLAVYFKDITQTRILLELQRLEKEVLEMNIHQGNHLETILNYYLGEIEKIHPGIQCSIIRLQGDQLFTWAAPSLPVQYNNSIKGLIIDDQTSPFALIAMGNKKIIAESIAEDPAWIKFSKLAIENDLQACWSYPLKDSRDKLQGILAVYNSDPRVPSVSEETTIEKATRLIQLILENKEYENTILVINESLQKRASQLAASNEELERFAYIASHDLQEPLRMVKSFLQLLEKKYSDHLDETAGKYIHFAVDGAERMKKLIHDLLDYSRVATNTDPKGITDMNAVMTEVLANLSETINELGASVEVGHLPSLPNTRKTQMLQLLQNLVSNALKYHSDQQPVIKISATEKNNHWEFQVSDNGIGIHPRFAEKIFIIFQRLHNKSEYSGTGIGLSICKKIVQRYNGSIWMDSTEGKGSTFYFTIQHKTT